jgi:coproporphyrinogen III oxidase-like Fe-S oxidoreductase
MFSKYKPVFEDTMGLGLLEIAGNRIRLTDQGRFLSNEVFWRLLPDS